MLRPSSQYRQGLKFSAILYAYFAGLEARTGRFTQSRRSLVLALIFFMQAHYALRRRDGDVRLSTAFDYDYAIAFIILARSPQDGFRDESDAG